MGWASTRTQADGCGIFFLARRFPISTKWERAAWLSLIRRERRDVSTIADSAAAALHSTIADLETICEEKRQLDQQRKYHLVLHGWLLVHIPLSYAVLLLEPCMQ